MAPPVPVKLLGNGKLDDNLFPLDSVKLATLPKLARDAKTGVAGRGAAKNSRTDDLHLPT